MLALVLLIGSLHGVVMRGPIMPVCRVGTPCDAPAKHLTLLFTRDGVTSSATTNDYGRYHINLAPGTYTVSTQNAQPIGRGLEPQTVVVFAHRDRRASFHLDTGIR